MCGGLKLDAGLREPEAILGLRLMPLGRDFCRSRGVTGSPRHVSAARLVAGACPSKPHQMATSDEGLGGLRPPGIQPIDGSDKNRGARTRQRDLSTSSEPVHIPPGTVHSNACSSTVLSVPARRLDSGGRRRPHRPDAAAGGYRHPDRRRVRALARCQDRVAAQRPAGPRPVPAAPQLNGSPALVDPASPRPSTPRRKTKPPMPEGTGGRLSGSWTRACPVDSRDML